MHTRAHTLTRLLLTVDGLRERRLESAYARASECCTCDCRQRSNGLFLQAEELRIMKEQTEKAAQAASKEKVVRIALCQSVRAATSPVLL